MLNVDMSKSEIEEVLNGKGDYVQMDYLAKFLEKPLSMDMKKFIYLKLANLYEKNLISVIHQVVNNGIPLFGICLGLQLLFTSSSEMGSFKGLNMIEGEVIFFDNMKVGKVPHIGWNCIEIQNINHFIIQGIPNNSYFYLIRLNF